MFAAGDKWLKAMVEIVGADLKKQFVEKPGFEEALEPESLAKLLREPAHYCWRANRLELIFNAYESGPTRPAPSRSMCPTTGWRHCCGKTGRSRDKEPP